MKNIKLNTIKKISTLIAAMLLSFVGFSQSHVTMSLKNITTTNNTIEYDLYIVNDGNTSLKLSGCSYGINFDASILNGGKVSFSYNQQSRGQALQGLTDYSLGVTTAQSTSQVRMTTTIAKIDKAPVLLPNTPFKVGRFKMTNSTQWKAKSSPLFSLHETSFPGLTNTQIAAFVNNEQHLTALTTSQHTVTTLVELSPILNDAASISTGTVSNSSMSKLNEKFNIYPNPATHEMNLEVVMNHGGVLYIKIDDLNGRTIKQIETNVVDGFNMIKIDVQDLAKGMYTIKVDDHRTINQMLKFSKL